MDSTTNNDVANESSLNVATSTNMIKCQDCGREVAEMSMMMHKLNACAGIARMSAPSNSDNNDTEDMEIDNDDDDNENTDPTKQEDMKPAAISRRNANDRAQSSSSPNQDWNNDTSTATTPGMRQRSGKRRSRSSGESSDSGQNEIDQEVVDILGQEIVDLVNPSRRNRHGSASAATAASNNVVDLLGAEVVDLVSPERNRATAPSADAAASGAAAASGSSPDSDEWACPQCTLLNSKTLEACDACHFRNPDRPPDATRREQLIPDDYNGGGMSYVGHGALLGGMLGAAGSYMRGRNMLSGAAEGAMTGGLGGALFNEVMNSSAGGATSNAGMAAGGGNASSRMNEVLNVTSLSSENYNPNLAQARSSVAMGIPGYPSFASAEETRNRRARPRSSYRVTRTTDSDGMMTTMIQGGSGGSTRVRARHSFGNAHLNDPMLSFMLHGMIQQHGRSGAGGGDVEGMDYEQLLRAFGDGTENMGAEESQIQRLPTQRLSDAEIQKLPEDARNCNICLEEFESGETRITMPCLHGFHKECAEKWLRTNGSCPICKHRIE